MSRETIRARVAAATEGPWEVIDLIGSRPAAASVWTAEDGEHDVCLSEEVSPADAAFIAHARQDIPALLAVADAAAAVMQRWMVVQQAGSADDHVAYGIALAMLDDALDALEALP